MTAVVEKVSREKARNLIFSSPYVKMSYEDQVVVEKSLRGTPTLWAGLVDGKLIGVWGLVPPTLLDNKAYMWMITTQALGDHTFVFVRHSRMALEKIFDDYPTIVGKCLIEAEESIRWIKWLGGVFGEPDGRFVPFTIRKR